MRSLLKYFPAFIIGWFNVVAPGPIFISRLLSGVRLSVALWKQTSFGVRFQLEKAEWYRHNYAYAPTLWSESSNFRTDSAKIFRELFVIGFLETITRFRSQLSNFALSVFLHSPVLLHAWKLISPILFSVLIEAYFLFIVNHLSKYELGFHRRKSIHSESPTAGLASIWLKFLITRLWSQSRKYCTTACPCMKYITGIWTCPCR